MAHCAHSFAHFLSWPWLLLCVSLSLSRFLCCCWGRRIKSKGRGAHQNSSNKWQLWVEMDSSAINAERCWRVFGQKTIL